MANFNVVLSVDQANFLVHCMETIRDQAINTIPHISNQIQAQITALQQEEAHRALDDAAKVDEESVKEKKVVKK